MLHLFIIALGGGFGAVSRYGISKLISNHANVIFPLGTLAVNLIGSFIIGFMFELFDKVIVPSDLRSFLTIGFLGAFTTFSTYSLETVNLLRDGELKLGIINIMVSNISGIVLVIAGIIFCRFILHLR